jgi:hypothetical protein
VATGLTEVQEGVLEDNSGCVMLRSLDMGQLWMILWPPGSFREGLSFRALGTRLTLGQRVRLGGGGLSGYDLVRPLVDREIPPECREHRFWLLTDLR